MDTTLTNVEAKADEGDDDVWSQKSDIEHLKRIIERASIDGPSGDPFDERSMTSQRYKGSSGWNAKQERIKPITRDRDWGVMPEEAVMKIVTNLDSNAISAEAM